MTMFHVAVYHNANGQFVPYRCDDALTAAFGFSRAMPADTTAEQLAEWTFYLLNTNSDMFEDTEPTFDTASAVLIASRYRLLRLRSLSVGDAVRISTATTVSWLACDHLRWTRIAAPPEPARRPIAGADDAAFGSDQRRDGLGLTG
jgi:hypothetical protein